MSNIFESKFLNEYFASATEKENFTLEDLKTKSVQIVNPNPDELIRISEKDLQTICSLGYKYICFDGIDLGNAVLPQTDLECLELENCIVEECDFSKVNIEKTLIIYGDNKLNNNGLSQFKNMSNLQELVCVGLQNLDLSEIGNLKNLKQLYIRGEIANYSGIQNLQQLKNITIEGGKGVEKYLPDTDRLETIEIEDDELTDIGFLANYPNLREVVLPNSKLDETQLHAIYELERKGISITFDESTLKEQLTQRKYELKEYYEEVEESIFGISSYLLKKELGKPIELNDYDIYNQIKTPIRIELNHIKALDKMIKSGLLSNNSILSKMNLIEGMDFVVENLEDMTPEVIEYFSKNKDKNFRFVVRTLNGLDSEVLEKLEENSENIEFYVRGDKYHFINKKNTFDGELDRIGLQNLDYLEPYRVKDMKEFISVLEPVKEQAMQARSDLEKFAIIRKVAIMSVKYDKSGVRESDTYNYERGAIARSLKGIFNEGRGVCVGKALGFLMMAEYVGLNAKTVSGTNVENGIGHEWNQVRIVNEEGIPIWYNVDITNDPDIIKDDGFILASNEAFNKKYKPFGDERVEECPEDMPNEYVHKASLRRTLQEDEVILQVLGIKQLSEIAYEGQYSGKKITPEDIKKILGTLTLSEIKNAVDILGGQMKSSNLDKNDREEQE